MFELRKLLFIEDYFFEGDYFLRGRRVEVKTLNPVYRKGEIATFRSDQISRYLNKGCAILVGEEEGLT